MYKPGNMCESLRKSFPVLFSDFDVRAEMTTAFLDAIRPETAPRLRMLAARSPSTCTHCWVHSDAVAGVMARNPRLHYEMGVIMECEGCEGCEGRDCHPGWDDDDNLGLFSHPEEQECPLGTDHGSSWVHWIKA